MLVKFTKAVKFPNLTKEQASKCKAEYKVGDTESLDNLPSKNYGAFAVLVKEETKSKGKRDVEPNEGEGENPDADETAKPSKK